MSASMLRADARHLPLDAASIDAIVCDPPYELGFMAKAWDGSGVAFDPATWVEALRVLKPGGHLLAFGGTRTYHRMTVAIEDAGFMIRDCLTWLYGSGFPKSLDVSKAIDRQRDDRDQILAVTRWIAAARDAAGRTNGDLDAAFGFAGMAGHWTSQQSQPAVPTLEQIPTLLAVLGDPDVPPEIERLILDLNGRKGEPGEAWFRREKIGERTHINGGGSALELRIGPRHEVTQDVTIAATDAAREWDGWGTALKPAWEPIVLARKPLSGTVAQNVTEHGTGALNIDGARIGAAPGDYAHPGNDGIEDTTAIYGDFANKNQSKPADGGRWPANVVLDEEAAALLDAQAGSAGAGGQASGATRTGHHATHTRGDFLGTDATAPFYADAGGPSRFYYTAKASRTEREAGLDALDPQTPGDLTDRNDGAAGTSHPRAGSGRGLSADDSIAAWVNAVLAALRQADTGALLRRVTAGFDTADGSAWSTTSYGNASGDRSPRASKSTTSTATSSTTGSPTSEPLTLARISASIRDALSRAESGSSPATFAAIVSRLIENTGTSDAAATRSTDDAVAAISARLFELSKRGGQPVAVNARKNVHPT